MENKETVFLFSDTQIKQESFLEDVNNLLSSGVVPGLFLDDELAPLRDSVVHIAKQQGLDQTPDVLWYVLGWWWCMLFYTCIFRVHTCLYLSLLVSTCRHWSSLVVTGRHWSI